MLAELEIEELIEVGFIRIGLIGRVIDQCDRVFLPIEHADE